MSDTPETDETMEALEKCREDSICYAEHMRRCGYSAAYKESQENADRAESGPYRGGAGLLPLGQDAQCAGGCAHDAGLLPPAASARGDGAGAYHRMKGVD